MGIYNTEGLYPACVRCCFPETKFQISGTQGVLPYQDTVGFGDPVIPNRSVGPAVPNQGLTLSN